MADDKPGWMTRTQWSELDDGRHTPLPGRSTVADDPREVAARVLAAEEARGNRPRFTDPYAPPDAVTLARYVQRMVGWETVSLEDEVAQRDATIARLERLVADAEVLHRSNMDAWGRDVAQRDATIARLTEELADARRFTGGG